MKEKSLEGMALCPASCGEIVQGSIGSLNFLITCPVALYSKVTVKLSKEKYDYQWPKSKVKALKAAKKTLNLLGEKSWNIYLDIKSQIPDGIGLASSTADICATCLAVASAFGKKLPPEMVANIALSIEPSDGNMFAGSVLFDHITGGLRKPLGPLPDMKVYIVDTKEKIDTLEFNDNNGLQKLNIKKQVAVVRALKNVLIAFKKRDKALLGQAMIQSALAHQQILPKPHLEDIISLAEKYNAFGVNIAHSGSAIGIFFDRFAAIPCNFKEKIKEIMNYHKKDYQIIKTHTVNDGPRII